MWPFSKLFELRRTLLLAIIALFVLGANTFSWPGLVHAASNIYTSSNTKLVVGDTVSVSIMVATNGQAANSFQGTFSYPAALFDPVRGSYSGSVCSLPIQQPDPSGGSATFICGTPGGFTGTGLVATVVLTAKAAGSGSFTMSDCQVLANDGSATPILGSCSGSSVSISAVATPPPTPVPTPTPTPTPRPKITPAGSAKPVETPKITTPTPTPTPPPVQTLPSSTPTPAVAGVPSPEPSPTPSDTPQPEQRRTVSQAFSSLFSSLKDIGKLPKDAAGATALVLTILPALILTFFIVFLVYRLYLLERRRRRTLDRLFEMELAELSALEGKMDLLAQKGDKGRAEYQGEFEKAKETILRQLRPDYGKPVEPPAKTTNPPLG